MKIRKTTILIALALLLAARTVPAASAVTTGSWDMGRARQSVQTAAAQMIRQEQETEPAPEEYTVQGDSGWAWPVWLTGWLRRMEVGK